MQPIAMDETDAPVQPAEELPGYERGLHAAALAGDTQAWQLLYETAFARLDAYIVWRCGGRRDLADEILQETWLIAVRRLRDFDAGRGRFLRWLQGIASNVLRNRLRRLTRERRQPIDAEPIDPRYAPETCRRQERVMWALAALPEHYEQALRAKYLDGDSVASMARRSGDSLKAVESLLSRARQAFRQAYAAED